MNMNDCWTHFLFSWRQLVRQGTSHNGQRRKLKMFLGMFSWTFVSYTSRLFTLSGLANELACLGKLLETEWFTSIQNRCVLGKWGQRDDKQTTQISLLSSCFRSLLSSTVVLCDPPQYLLHPSNSPFFPWRPWPSLHRSEVLNNP